MPYILGIIAAAAAWVVLQKGHANSAQVNRVPVRKPTASTVRQLSAGAAPSAGLQTIFQDQSDAVGSSVTGEPDYGHNYSSYASLAGTGFGTAVGATGGATSSLAFAGAATIPIVGAAIAGIGLALSAIFAHHKQAMQKEYSSILKGVNAYYQLVGETVKSYNNGQITRAQAIGYLDQAMQVYYGYVKGIMKGTVPAGGGAVHPGAMPAGCNGPCVVAFVWLEGFTHQLKAIFASPVSGGAFTIGPIPPANGFPGIGKLRVVIARVDVATGRKVYYDRAGKSFV